MGSVQVKIAELLLDLENPRFAGATSQREALQKTIDDQQGKLLVLAQSIVDQGMNPMDRLLVLAQPGGLVVLEGNRRLAALRILANSSVLDGLDVTASYKKAFDKLAKTFRRSTVEPLSCFEVEDRVAARTWILLRHTGANDGKGVVDWSAMASSRFRGQDPALQALDFVRLHGNLTEAQKALLEDRFPITTLDRLLSSREVRQRLGFDVKDGKLRSGLAPEELVRGLRRMVLDLAERRVNVSGLKNREQQADYFDNKFDQASKPDLASKGKVRPVEDISEGDFKRKPAQSAPPRKRSVKDPAERKSIVPGRNHLSVTDSRIAHIFRELRLLKVDDTPNAIAVLFRVFLELSIDHFLEKNNLPTKYKQANTGKELDKNLTNKLEDVINHLISEGRDKKAYAGVKRSISVERSPLYIDLLHGYVHNRFTTPKSHDLIASWDEASRFFEDLWS